jgi:hypothetical protein
VLTRDALRYGVNIRNLRTLEVLDKLRRIVTSDSGRIDAEQPMVFGKGTIEEPIDIPGLPFGFSSSFEGKRPSRLSDYRTCGGEAGKNGPEAVYRFQLIQPTAIRAIALAGECENTEICTMNKDVTVAIFKDKLDMKSCLSAGSTIAKATLAPGSYYIVMDSAQDKTQPKSGILAVHQCVSGDTRCSHEDGG